MCTDRPIARVLAQLDDACTSRSALLCEMRDWTLAGGEQVPLAWDEYVRVAPLDDADDDAVRCDGCMLARLTRTVLTRDDAALRWSALPTRWCEMETLAERAALLHAALQLSAYFQVARFAGDVLREAAQRGCTLATLFSLLALAARNCVALEADEQERFLSTWFQRLCTCISGGGSGGSSGSETTTATLYALATPLLRRVMHRGAFHERGWLAQAERDFACVHAFAEARLALHAAAAAADTSLGVWHGRVLQLTRCEALVHAHVGLEHARLFCKPPGRPGFYGTYSGRRLWFVFDAHARPYAYLVYDTRPCGYGYSLYWAADGPPSTRVARGSMRKFFRRNDLAEYMRDAANECHVALPLPACRATCTRVDDTATRTHAQPCTHSSECASLHAHAYTLDTALALVAALGDAYLDGSIDIEMLRAACDAHRAPAPLPAACGT